LLVARKAAKKAMKEAKNDTLKQIFNGRQLALKVCCNSIYGFCGAVNGYLPCLKIAATVTSIGRNLIMETKKIIEETYTIEKGYSSNAEVIYGDTDSVMVDFHLVVPEKKIEEQSKENDLKNNDHAAMLVRLAMDRGIEAANLVTQKFPTPIFLSLRRFIIRICFFLKSVMPDFCTLAHI